MSRAVLHAILGGLLDLLAPRSCPGCDLALDPGEVGFCGGCAPLLERLDPSAAGGAAYLFGGPLADAIRRLKYRGRTDHAGALGRLLADACAPLAGRVDVVVPIPLHPRRLRERGFNQASVLGAFVAERLGVPLDASGLQRLRDTPAQAGLDAIRRVDNVRGCFAGRVRLERTRVLVLDDVRTTGATFADAARALSDAGATEVCVRALAGAEDRDQDEPATSRRR